MASKAEIAQAAHDAAVARVTELEAQYRARARGEPGDPTLYVALAAAREDVVHASAEYEAAVAADARDADTAESARRRALVAKLTKAVRAQVADGGRCEVAANQLRQHMQAARAAGAVRHELAQQVLTFGLDDTGVATAHMTMGAIAGVSEDWARALAELFYVIVREDNLQDAIRPWVTFNLFALDSVREPLSFKQASSRDAEHVLLRLPTGPKE